MDGRFAVFISRKTVKDSFVCELGMQVLFPATGKSWEQSEFSRKIEQSWAKKKKKMYLINFASVLTYGLCSCVDWLPQIQHSNVMRELFLTPAW